MLANGVSPVIDREGSRDLFTGGGDTMGGGPSCVLHVEGVRFRHGQLRQILQQLHG